MTLISKAIVVCNICQRMELFGTHLGKRKLKLANTPVLVWGHTHILLKYPLECSFVEIQFLEEHG